MLRRRRGKPLKRFCLLLAANTPPKRGVNKLATPPDDNLSNTRLQPGVTSHRSDQPLQRFPMQARCLSERTNNSPLLIAGEAKVFSPSSFFAIGVNSLEARTTFITPSSFKK